VNTSQALQHARSLDIEPLEAQTLLLHVWQRPLHDRAWLLLNDTLVLSKDQHTQFQQGLQRLLNNEPLAYVTGWQAFHGLELQITPDVLVPRADTETLVNWALTLDLPQARVLDLGTGSGAVALALQHERRLWDVHALDHSADALAVAQANAQRLKLPVHFAQGDWLHGAQGRFHAIVSNPPYVAEGDPHLDALRHEPTLALSSGADGLDAIRSIIASAPQHLHPGGWLLLEHGFEQAQAVCALLAQAGFSDVQTRHDLAGLERCSGARWTTLPTA
jgi:release factor glutamine methyltransferase